MDSMDIGAMTLASIGQLLDDVQRLFDGMEKRCAALELQRGRLEERVMKLKAYAEGKVIPQAAPFRDRDAWLSWAFNHCAVGEFQQSEGVMLGRPEQRTYTLCVDEKIQTFSGQSIADAQSKVRRFLKTVKAPPRIQGGAIMAMGVG